MESRAHALAAGLFVIFMGLALGVVLWWFSTDREATREYLLVSNGSISGLSEQSGVRYRGIRAGKVEQISIDPARPREILIRISLLESLPVTRGTSATLSYQGVTGLAFVQMDDDGSDPTPLAAADSGPPRLTLEPGLIDQISDTTLETLRKLQGVAERIGEFIDEKSMNRLAASLRRLESAAEGLDRTFTEAPALLARVRELLNEQNAGHLARALERLDGASAQLDPAMRELREVFARLDSIGARLDAAAGDMGHGLAEGTLPRVNDLLEELAQTAVRVNRLVERIETAPQALVLGQGKGPPGPGEPGFAQAQEGAGK
jgi:phospholipid/cholesterol/gamma-HCH transport system substrate-binding protein